VERRRSRFADSGRGAQGKRGDIGQAAGLAAVAYHRGSRRIANPAPIRP
jgi:hypothetical protein